MAPHLRYPWFGFRGVDLTSNAHLIGAFLQRDAIAEVFVADAFDVLESQGVAELVEYGGLEIAHLVPRPVPPLPDARSPMINRGRRKIDLGEEAEPPFWISERTEIVLVRRRDLDDEILVVRQPRRIDEL